MRASELVQPTLACLAFAIVLSLEGGAATAQSCPSGYPFDCGDGRCCPESHPQCCEGDTCCLPSAACAPGGGCMAPGPTCRSDQRVCGDLCIPSDSVCCTSAGYPGRYCPAGTTCRTDGSCSGGGGSFDAGPGGSPPDGSTCFATGTRRDFAGETDWCTQAPCEETVGSVEDYRPGTCSTSNVLYCCYIDRIRSFIYDCGTSRCDNWDGPDGYRTVCESSGGRAYRAAECGGGSPGPGGRPDDGSPPPTGPRSHIFGCSGCVVGAGSGESQLPLVVLLLGWLLVRSRRRTGEEDRHVRVARSRR